MPRASQRSLSTVVIDDQARPEPWPGLAAAETAYWRQIVNSLPPTWFRPSDLPLLAGYCRMAIRMDRAEARLATEDMAVVNEKTGQVLPNPHHMIVRQSLVVMANLAMKLRLCPSARYAADKAESHVRKSGASKPWRATGTE